jgi:hypothetical protein
MDAIREKEAQLKGEYDEKQKVVGNGLLGMLGGVIRVPAGEERPVSDEPKWPENLGWSDGLRTVQHSGDGYWLHL